MSTEEIDHIIDGFCQEFDSLSDAFVFTDHTNHEDPHPRWDGAPEDDPHHDPTHSGIGGTFRPSGNAGGFLNMFPASSRGPCRRQFVLILPANPLRQKCGITPHERERQFIAYFQNALVALHRWASRCRGTDVFLVTEQWPIAPGITQSPLWLGALHKNRWMLDYWHPVRRPLVNPYLDPSLTFHEQLKEFRNWNPDLNFHIRLASMPRRKPVRFCYLAGDPWPSL